MAVSANEKSPASIKLMWYGEARGYGKSAIIFLDAYRLEQKFTINGGGDARILLIHVIKHHRSISGMAVLL